MFIVRACFVLLWRTQIQLDFPNLGVGTLFLTWYFTNQLPTATVCLRPILLVAFFQNLIFRRNFMVLQLGLHISDVDVVKVLQKKLPVIYLSGDWLRWIIWFYGILGLTLKLTCFEVPIRRLLIIPASFLDFGNSISRLPVSRRKEINHRSGNFCLPFLWNFGLHKCKNSCTGIQFRKYT